MISGKSGGNGLAAHYDWIALAVGVLVLAGGAVFYVMSAGGNSEEAAADAIARLNRMKPADVRVAPLDMAGLQAVTAGIRKPAQLAEIGDRAASFLASERRVLCVCGKVLSGDVKLVPVCPYCGAKQQEEKAAVLDADGDGIADEWEKKFGLSPSNPADAALDADGDGFTNLEEYEAKTDPKDPKSHPDYLDSLKIVLPLKETSMPFVFSKANKIPTGWRCEFFNPTRKDDYGRMGMKMTAKIGDEIGDTGFILRDHVAKTAKRPIPGSELMRTVDASEVILERKRDGRKITLVVQPGRKNIKLASVDVQATLSYERGSVKTFDVVPGADFTLGDTKYQVSDIKAVGKGAKVTVKETSTGRVRVLEALEP